MANEIRVRTGFVGGLVEDAPLAVGATTLTSAGLASLPVIGTTQHQALVLDPDGIGGSPEIVYVTAHTASATTATIARGQEGTTARAHLQDVPWIHGPTVKDFDGSGGGAGLIGFTSWSPAATSPAATSSTYADIDATNLAVAFTVPPSGRVLIGLCANVAVAVNNTLGWGLREATTDVATSEVLYNGAVGTTQPTLHRRFYVSGLVAGAAKTYKWSHARTFGSGAVSTNYGGVTGPAIMEVWAVNL